jgi:polysaccharide export outer membrane protein
MALAVVLGTAALAWAQASYELGAGDVVRVDVVGQENMTGTFTIDESGMLPFPILGQVKASQMTAAELQRKLTTLLADGYVKRPQVAVVVQEYQRQRVYVTGEVRRPGAYALRGDRTLLALLRELDGLAPNVGHEVIVIRPPAGGPGPLEVSATDEGSAAVEDEGGAVLEADPPTEPPPPGDGDPPRQSWRKLPNEVPGAEIHHVNLTELVSGNPERNLELLPGDTVFFPPTAHVYVTGHVARPGPIEFEEGMSVFHAVTLAGGLTARGSKNVKVIRIVGEKQVEKKVEMTDVVEPEDTIVVPERFF